MPKAEATVIAFGLSTGGPSDRASVPKSEP